jgi:hypothetical protein
MRRPLRQHLALGASSALVRVALLASSLFVAAGLARAGDQFQRCDPFMLRTPEGRLREPGRDSGFASPPSWHASARRTRALLGPRDGPGSPGPSAQWTRLEPLELGSATSNLVVDRPRDRLVLFGAYSFFEFVNHVWTRPLSDDHAQWERIDVPGVQPGRYTAPTTVYDPVRERLVVLGGYPGDGVWALTLSGPPQWMRLSLNDPGLGGNMNGTVAIYDPIGDRVVVVAGSTPQGGAAVWAFALGDASGWTLLEPEGTAPSPRDNYHAVYDRNRRRMLVCSGFAAGTPADVWTLSLAGTLAWESIATTGDVPPGTYQGAAAYDPVHDRLVIADGIAQSAPGGATDDAWVLQFGGVPTWRHIRPEERPVARNGPCMAYDEQRDRFVMFGGGISDTWSLSIGRDTVWTLIQPDPLQPFALYNLGLVDDPKRHRLLRFGGHAHSFVHGTPQPGESDELLGLTTDRFEHWTLERREPPPAMAGMSTLLDPGADRLITVGGHAMRSGLWGTAMELDLGDTTSWRTLPVVGTEPPARTMQSAVADPVRRRVVVFGGRSTTGALGDGWLLNLHDPSSWTPLDSIGLAPSARYGHGMIYDPVGDRVVLFGGRDDAGNTYSDTWQLSLAGTPAWSRLTTPAAPSARSHAAVVYDPLRQRVVLFGGRSPEGAPLRDTWFLPLAEGATWVLADSTGVLPRERWAAGAAFDVENDRIGGGERHLRPLQRLLGHRAPGRLGDALVGCHPGTAGSRLVGAASAISHARMARHRIGPVHGLDLAAHRGFTVANARRRCLGTGRRRSLHGHLGRARHALRIPRDVEQRCCGKHHRAGLDRDPRLTSRARASREPVAGRDTGVALAARRRSRATRRVGRVGPNRGVARSARPGPGDHTLQLTAPGALVSGRYWVRLVVGAETRTSGVVVLR